jgi:hypothetical protein
LPLDEFVLVISKLSRAQKVIYGVIAVVGVGIAGIAIFGKRLQAMGIHKALLAMCDTQPRAEAKDCAMRVELKGDLCIESVLDKAIDKGELLPCIGISDGTAPEADPEAAVEECGGADVVASIALNLATTTATPGALERPWNGGTLYLLPASSIDRTAVDRVSIIHDATAASEATQLKITLTAAGSESLRAMTTDPGERLMALSLDDQVLMAAAPQAPLTGGTLTVPAPGIQGRNICRQGRR